MHSNYTEEEHRAYRLYLLSKRDRHLAYIERKKTTMSRSREKHERVVLNKIRKELDNPTFYYAGKHSKREPIKTWDSATDSPPKHWPI